uniref:Wall-associated receptor kinase galacturonan-binding domain-containing protein n=1 Tax=Quercus lobata TaxID=97700 RepID=A0A7N2MBX8_QUELO
MCIVESFCLLLKSPAYTKFTKLNDLLRNSGAIGFHRMLLQLTWAGVILSNMAAAAKATAIAFPSALPNCPDKCGEIQIPYPFGLTEGCYLKGITSFFINCTPNSKGEPLPLTGNVIVTNISIIQGRIDILMYNTIDCYNELGTRLSYKWEWQRRLYNLIFTIFETQNTFVAVGCDTYAYLNGFQNDQPFSIGCLSRCQNISNVVNGKFSRIGCCQIQIPGGLKNITLEAYSFKKQSFVFDFNPCSYAFIIREDEFKFSSVYLTTLRNNKTLPMVLDWTIGSEKCDLAWNKSSYICGENMLKIRSVLSTRASIEIQLKEEAVIKPSKQR